MVMDFWSRLGVSQSEWRVPSYANEDKIAITRSEVPPQRSSRVYIPRNAIT